MNFACRNNCTGRSSVREGLEHEDLLVLSEARRSLHLDDSFRKRFTMMAGHWLRYSAALLFCGGIFIGFVAAQTDDTKKPLPKPIANNTTPETIAELRAMEEHTQKVLKKVIPAVVGIRVGPGQGTGVIIERGRAMSSPPGTSPASPGKIATSVCPTANTLKGKTLGQDKDIDSGLIKIMLDEKRTS